MKRGLNFRVISVIFYDMQCVGVDVTGLQGSISSIVLGVTYLRLIYKNWKEDFMRTVYKTLRIRLLLYRSLLQVAQFLKGRNIMKMKHLPYHTGGCRANFSMPRIANTLAHANSRLRLASPT